MSWAPDKPPIAVADQIARQRKADQQNAGKPIARATVQAIRVRLVVNELLS